MKDRYPVKEIFLSLQGEGFWTGTPMVFVRFSGCNLSCPFCDTDHAGGSIMSAGEIGEAVLREGGKCRRICLTGGEPTLYADNGLIGHLHSLGYTVHLETNGTMPVPEGTDWVCLSPKEFCCPEKGKVMLGKADELKLVFDGSPLSCNEARRWETFPASWHFLQPCDGVEGSVEATVAYVKAHPSWRLSLQTHKLIGIA